MTPLPSNSEPANGKEHALSTQHSAALRDFRRGEQTRRSCSQLIRDRRDLAAPLMNGPACRVSVHIAWPAPCDSDTQHDRLIYGDPMDKTEAESRVLQSDASGDTHAVSAPSPNYRLRPSAGAGFSRAGAADGFAPGPLTCLRLLRLCHH